MAESSERALTPDEASCAAAARREAFAHHEGMRTPDRSCRAALVESFGRAAPPCQAPRRGGITGWGSRPAITPFEDP